MADFIIEVKKPKPTEYKMAKRNQGFFSFFHFASDRRLAYAMTDSYAVCTACETLETTNKVLPILVPMPKVFRTDGHSTSCLIPGKASNGA